MKRPFVLPPKSRQRAIRMTKGARALTAFRKKKRPLLSQKSLAALLFTTQATVSRLEAGYFRPNLEMAMAIERATKGVVTVGLWTEASK